MALPVWMAFPGPDGGPGVGCVCHDPRLAGHVCPNPRTPAAGPRGMGATTPVYRGMCATTPKGGCAYRRVPAATGHTENAASITTRRAELARLLRDLSKTDLPITLPHSCCSGSASHGTLRPTDGADGKHGTLEAPLDHANVRAVAKPGQASSTRTLATTSKAAGRNHQRLPAGPRTTGSDSRPRRTRPSPRAQASSSRLVASRRPG
jgi:hypothetical protein